MPTLFFLGQCIAMVEKWENQSNSGNIQDVPTPGPDKAMLCQHFKVYLLSRYLLKARHNLLLLQYYIHGSTVSEQSQCNVQASVCNIDFVVGLKVA